MNILFISIAWPPRGERNLYSDLMHEFLKKGHQVYVVCNDEHAHHTHAEQLDGIHVLRVKSSKIRKAKKFQKAISLFTLGGNFKKALYKQYPGLQVDLILGHSPPITLSKLFLSLKKKYNAPAYYLLKDIWPEGPADLKIIRRNGIVYRFFRSQEKQTYKAVDFIGCMSPMNVDYLLKKNRFLSAEKVEVCPNTITPRKLAPNVSKKDIRTLHKIPEDARVFIFSGNLGKAHGLDFYLDAIEKLKEYKQAYFLIGGSGTYFKFLEKEIVRREISNIGIYSRLPAEEFDQLLMSCDVGVVLLSSSYTVPQFPSRLLAYLEAGLPVFCAVNRDTDIGSIVEESGCGKSVIHGDQEAFRGAVEFFCDPVNSKTVESMGRNSKDLLKEQYTSANSYEIIMKRMLPETTKNSDGEH
jgi:glycosyltransferase involved in cell wall biosynthesis